MNLFSEFQSGSVLNRTMLCSLRDYPLDLINLLFNSYPEGIISGFDITVCDNIITISGGIVKIDNRILTMNENKMIDAIPGNWYCIVTVEKAQKDNCDSYELIPKLLSQDEPCIGIELCRFTFNSGEGVQLRGIPSEFRNIAEPLRNTIDISNRKVSKSDGGYLPEYRVLRLFGEEVLRKGKASSEDIAFAYLCLNGFDSSRPVYCYTHISSDASIRDIINKLMDKLGKTTNKPQTSSSVEKNRQKEIKII